VFGADALASSPTHRAVQVVGQAAQQEPAHWQLYLYCIAICRQGRRASCLCTPGTGTRFGSAGAGCPTPQAYAQQATATHLGYTNRAQWCSTCIHVSYRIHAHRHMRTFMPAQAHMHGLAPKPTRPAGSLLQELECHEDTNRGIKAKGEQLPFLLLFPPPPPPAPPPPMSTLLLEALGTLSPLTRERGM